MLKTIYFFFFFWLGLALSVVLLAVYYLLKMAGLKKAEKQFVFLVTSNWARLTLHSVAIKLKVSGKENIPPSHNGFVVISNHQGNFDIPVIIGCLPFSAGFVAKKELMKLPFLNIWMKAIHCLFINRARARESAKKLSERICQTDKNPIFLFPEGTRSKGPQMGTFKPVSLNLIFHEGIDILPVTISGSYKCYEEYNSIKSSTVRVTFHPILKTNGYKKDEFAKFTNELQEIIAGALKENNPADSVNNLLYQN
jgi:1-acyl-sn-glycerol-3-phosphate acyltransferase